jgi:putative cardiolipin synthase
MEYLEIKFCDQSFQIVMRELLSRAATLKKSGSNLRVRIIVDELTFQTETPRVSLIAVTKEFKRLGIEIRFFNPGLVRDVAKWNQRDHRKYMVIDGEQVITGGRNIADEYFGLATSMHRLDRDLWIKGPIAKDFAASFEQTWNHKLTREFSEPTARELDEYQRASMEPIPPSDLMALDIPNPDATRTAEQLRCLSAPRVEPWLFAAIGRDAANIERMIPAMEVKSIVAGFDSPGSYSKQNSFIPYFLNFLRSAQKSLVLENQYFIPDSGLGDVLADLKSRGVPVTVLTNSIFSEDGRGVGRLTHWYARETAGGSVRVLGFRGNMPEHPFVKLELGLSLEQAQGIRWQLHAKDGVVDGHSVWIGSNNLDPRSNNVQLEQAVFVLNNPEFAAMVTAAIEHDLTDAYSLERGSPYWDTYNKLNPDWLIEDMLTHLVKGYY